MVAVIAAAASEPVAAYAIAAPPNSPTVPAISHGR
jgi:hypothetical protein